jgi:ketopantoate reductase
MRCVVIGETAEGRLLAVALARTGEEVSLLLPPDRLPESGALRLTVVGPAGDEVRWAIIPAVATLSDLPEFAVLAISDRAIEQVLPNIVNLLGSAPVLLVGDSPLGDDLAIEALGSDRVLRGIVIGVRVLDRTGSVHVAGEFHLIVAGEASARAKLVSTLEATLAVSTAEDGRGCRWSAALLDLAQAPAALADLPMAQALADRRVRRRTIAILREATHVLHAANIVLAPLPDRDMRRLERLHAVPELLAGRALRQLALERDPANALPDSLAAALRAQRRQDLADLCEAFRRLARSVNIPIPTIERLAAEIHERAVGG